VPHEGLGAFEKPLVDAGFDIRYHDAWASPPLRIDEAVNASLLVVMGGPMGVYEARTYPFLKNELEALEARLAADRPTLGVCLGAQLIARAAGARVFPGERFEIGFAPVRLTDEGRDSCLAPLEDDTRVLHWHGDTYDLPRGATRLASSAWYREQAFSIGARILGLQFHLETSGPELDRWIDTGEDEIARGDANAAMLRAESRTLGPSLAIKAEAVIRRWLGDAGLR